MQRALWRSTVHAGALSTAVVLGLCLAVPPVKAQPSPSRQDYVAYRAAPAATPAERDELLKKALTAGLKPVEDSALARAGLWVFEVENAALAAKNAALFEAMERVPINEYRGVLSVPTGNYYLRFAAGISSATARQRVEALGFKILTPSTDSNSLLVVEGTGRSADRQRELNRLKALNQVLYVAPNDIPLRIPARNQ